MSGWPRVPMPYAIALGMLGFMAAGAFVFAFLTPSQNQELILVDSLFGVIILACMLLLWLWGPRTTDDWALDAVIVLVALLASIGSVMVPEHDGQLIVASGLGLLAIYSAYFRPPRVFAMELTFIVVAYVVALALNPSPLHASYIVVAVTVLIITSVTIAYLNDRMRHQIMSDPLSGLLNRRGLETVAAQLAAAARRRGEPLTVGIIDLDDFKEFNDREGHVAGDQRIVEVAAVLTATARRSDVIARFGGDEFAVILPGARPADAAELVRRAASPGSGEWSAGFAEWSPDEDLYEALQRADREMYRDKIRGNSVESR